MIDWLFQKHRKWSTEIEGLRDDKPSAADAPGRCQSESDNTQHSQRRQRCQRDDPYAYVYSIKTDATT